MSASELQKTEEVLGLGQAARRYAAVTALPDRLLPPRPRASVRTSELANSSCGEFAEGLQLELINPRPRMGKWPLSDDRKWPGIR